MLFYDLVFMEIVAQEIWTFCVLHELWSKMLKLAC